MVYDEAKVYGKAAVCDNVKVYCNATVCGDTCIYGDDIKITSGNYATGDFF